MTLYVADKKTGCSFSGSGTCLQVKEKPDAPYSLFYAGIKGFNYEEGYNYKLEVIRPDLVQPLSSQNPYRYYLLRVLSKEKTTGTQAAARSIPDQQILALDKISYNGRLEGVGSLRVPDIYFDLANGRISGNNNCNRYAGTVSTTENGSIRIGSLATTHASCAENDQADLFMQYLAASDRFAVKGAVLQLLNGNNVLLQFLVPAGR
ncbi:DUF4377 domain-containing protein [Sediminibacterium ginsengisoli]|uniref:DUF4377 domain-containing protein n=1 Tax=Sediminibacterium ginsengisoli TaxID=413434 RepID=UPI00373FCEBC